MADHIARQMKEAKKNYTGTIHGGNPPDAGSVMLRGKRIGWCPIDCLNMTEAQFDAILTAYKEKGDVLSRGEVRAAIARAEGED